MPPPYGTSNKPPGPQQINNGLNIVGNGNGNQNAGQQSNNQYSPTNQQFLENNINMNYINTACPFSFIKLSNLSHRVNEFSIRQLLYGMNVELIQWGYSRDEGYEGTAICMIGASDLRLALS